MIRWLGLIGVGIVVLGLVLVPLPGPGWPVVLFGVLVLALAGIAHLVSSRRPH